MAFDLDMISIGCVAPMDPVMKFSTRVSFQLSDAAWDSWGSDVGRFTHSGCRNHEHLEVMENIEKT